MVCNLVDQEIRRYPNGDVFTSIPPETPSGEPPAAITGLSVSSIASSEAVLTWSPNGGSITVYRRNVTANGMFEIVASSISGGATSYSDNGLTPSTQYQWRLTATNQYGTSPASNTVTATTEEAVVPVGDWTIAADYRIGQKLPMRLLWPRPDDETFEFSSHRKSNTNWAYKTRICVQGGEPPFRMQIIEGPAGSSIAGEFEREVDSETGLTVHVMPDGYATVRWPNPVGTANWNVLITDQAGDSLNAVWTTETDNSAFVVLDMAAGNNANPGTYSQPIQTFVSGLWKSSSTDATYANKIAAFKKGSYPIYQAIANQNISINANVKPRAYIAIEDDVEWLTDSGHIFVNTGDVSIVDIHLRGSRSDEANNRIIQVSTKDSNYLFWGLTFSEQTVGTSANDNPACIVFMDDSAFSENIAIVDCEVLGSAAMQLVCTFACDGVLIENNKGTNLNYPSSNGAAFIHPKDDTRNVSVRFNIATGNCPSGMIRMSNQQNAGMLALNQEVIYNYVNTTTVDWESGPIIWNQNATAQPNAANTHSARNTIISPTYAHVAREWNGGDRVQLSGNAYIAPGGLVFSSGSENVSPASVAMSNGDIESSGRLTSITGKRTQYLGKAGFEIATSVIEG